MSKIHVIGETNNEPRYQVGEAIAICQAKDGHEYEFEYDKWHGKVSGCAALLYFMQLKTIEDEKENIKKIFYSLIENGHEIRAEDVEGNIDAFSGMKKLGVWDNIDWIGKWWDGLVKTQPMDSLGYIFIYGARKTGENIEDGDCERMIQSFSNMDRKKQFIRACIRIYSLSIIRGWPWDGSQKNIVRLLYNMERKYGRVFIESEIVSYVWKNLIPAVRNESDVGFTKWILEHSKPSDRYNMLLWTCCQMSPDININALWEGLAGYSWDGNTKITPWESNYPPTSLADFLERVGVPTHKIGERIVRSIIDKGELEREIVDLKDGGDDDRKGGEDGKTKEKGGGRKKRLM